MHDILDLGRFPLDRPESADWAALVARCREDLARDGMFNLAGFMHPDVARAAADALEARFASEAFRHEREHNIYFLKDVPGLAPDHPALTRLRTSNDTLCWDQLTGSPMDRLYRWPELARFLAATMEREALYVMEDPLAGLNTMSYREGQALNWHFDRSEFTTTLLLQAPDAGGEFIYRTDLRSNEDPNYEGVAKMLAGADPEVRSLTLSPGTLNVFKGKNTPHRVGDVQGGRARVISVFSFYERPGVAFSEDERIGFYGRAG
ncbi:HalD/BesD family halogenase [Marimonas lutisalis]|uniref:HalD/BesD family halogenase n=1 Tax=Marimonas lutisalis TaxID=2545756 RepID=UPI0010F80CEA|nr:2OG-Fe(II) oxygenase [Marimonas lutisalis]